MCDLDKVLKLQTTESERVIDTWLNRVGSWKKKKSVKENICTDFNTVWIFPLFVNISQLWEHNHMIVSTNSGNKTVICCNIPFHE